MNNRDVELLVYSPAWIRGLIHHFLSGVSSQPNRSLKLELIYFVLPILYDDTLIEKLAKSNITSTLSSLSSNVEIKVKLSNIKNRAFEFKKETNSAMVLLGKENITIDNGFVFTPLPIKYQITSTPLKKHFKAAFNLGNILAKSHYREVFMKFGVYS